MRIGIISDIHGDRTALERALDEMQPVDRVFCAGDLVLQYRFSNDIFDIVRRRGIDTIRGNHEEAILSSAGAALRASGTIRPDNLSYLEALPKLLEMEIDGKHIVMMHTSPLDPTGGGRDLRDGVAPDEGAVRFDTGADHLPESRADVLIVGHTHHPVVTWAGQTLVINPGSLGQSRDPYQPHLRTYAILDTSGWQASVQQFDLPRET